MDSQSLAFCYFFKQIVSAQAELTRHRLNRDLLILTLAQEHRVNQVVGAESSFSDHITEGRSTTIAAGAIDNVHRTRFRRFQREVKSSQDLRIALSQSVLKFTVDDN